MGVDLQLFSRGHVVVEGTVAVRKVLVASIGVFGANLDRMQVHLTLFRVFLSFGHGAGGTLRV